MNQTQGNVLHIILEDLRSVLDYIFPEFFKISKEWDSTRFIVNLTIDICKSRLINCYLVTSERKAT